MARWLLEHRAMRRAFPLLLLLAACPDDEPGPDVDYVYSCPEITGSITLRGIDRGTTWYEDGVGSMVPGSTQLVMVGRWLEQPYRSEFDETFDAEVVGATGIDITRVSHNQFLLRADEPGSACVKFSNPDDPDDAMTVGLYSTPPRANEMTLRPIPDFSPRDNIVFAWASTVTVDMHMNGHPLVDSGLRFVTGPRQSHEAWDTLRLFDTGIVPIDVVTSDGTTTHFDVEVVNRADEIVLMGNEVPVALAANHQTAICVYAKHRGRVVAGIEWRFAVTNANWTTNEGMGFGGFYSGCVYVQPTTPGQRVEITAKGGGLEHVLAYDVY